MIFLLDSRGPSRHGKDADLIKQWLGYMVERKKSKLRELEVKYPRVSIMFHYDSSFDSTHV